MLTEAHIESLLYIVSGESSDYIDTWYNQRQTIHSHLSHPCYSLEGRCLRNQALVVLNQNSVRQT